MKSIVRLLEASQCLLLALFTLSLPAAPAEPSPKVEVTDHGWRDTKLPGRRWQRRREVELTAGEIHYVLHFRNTRYLDEAGEVTKTLASIGIQCATGGRGRHQGVGWYPNETMRIFANGRDLTATGGELRSPQILGRGKVGLVAVSLVHPLTTVRLRFALRPGQEGIDVAVAWEPGSGVRGRRLRLSCYPAFFTAWNKRRGDRWVVTPKRTLEEPREPGLDMSAAKWKHQVREVELDPAEEWWLFYYDKFFNSEKGRGKGLCGLVVPPSGCARADLHVSDYEISTALSLARQETEILRFTLWQRNIRDFEKPLSEFPSIAESARKRLADARLFSPPGLLAFDGKKKSDELTALSASLANVAELREQLLKTRLLVRKWRQTESAWAWKPQQETAAVSAVADYCRAVWQARRRMPRRFRILAVQGAHFPTWGLAECVERLPNGADIDASHFAVSWRGEWLSKFPASTVEMMRYDAVVLINVSAIPFKGNRGELLRKFVYDGGGLVVLGGFFAYGGGGYADSVLNDLLPVECGGPFDVKRLASPAPVLLAEGIRDGLGEVSGILGTVLWLHELRPKPDAATVLHARTGGGPRPFLIFGSRVQGRIAVCAGTVYGPGSAENSVFWGTRNWAEFLACTIEWACGMKDVSAW